MPYQRLTDAASLVISTKGKRMAHIVRQATIRDLEQLVPLFDNYRQFYGRASDLRAAREFLLARFNNDESTVFIAHEGEEKKKMSGTIVCINGGELKIAQ